MSMQPARNRRTALTSHVSAKSEYAAVDLSLDPADPLGRLK